MSDIISKDYMTTAEAAALLGVTTSRIRSLIASNLLESQLVGNHRFIKRSSVMGYAATPGARGHKKKVQRGAVGSGKQEG